MAHLRETSCVLRPSRFENLGYPLPQYGYQGFFWAFQRDLYDGKSPEISDFGKFIEALHRR